MRNVFMIVSLVVALGACGKDKFDAVIGEADGLKSKMCACTDEACTDKVQEEWSKFRGTLRDRLGKEKPSEDQDKKFRAIRKGVRECRNKHRGGGGGGAATSDKDKEE